MVKKILKNESGFTMVQTLATLILISLLGMGLILLAFQVSEQITVTQGISDKKSKKNFVTQEAKLTLDDELEKLFSEENLKGQSLGTNQKVLEKLMTEFIRTHQILNEDKFKKTSSASYQNKINSFEIEDMKSVKPGNEDEQGWVNGSNYYNYRIRIPIESTINDKKGNYTVASEYCYEIQWESKSAGEIVTETDIWGNVFFPINRPGGVSVISADTVMRQMSKIYHFQDTTPSDVISFTGGSSSQTLNGTYGIKDTYTTDMKDDVQAFDYSIGRAELEGSALISNGFSLNGHNQDANLTTKNLLALTNESGRYGYLSDSRIENVSIDARTGLLLSLDSESNITKKITIDNNGNNLINTTNLVINQTIDATNEEVGTFIESGHFTITAPKNEVVNFREYKGNSNTLNLQKNNWSSYQSGNFIISNSKVELGSEKKNEPVNIQVDNNFMLTNAGMSADLSENSFSYFDDNSKEKIRTPSLLSLKGKNTLFEVSGYSFIDSPKRYQRPLIDDPAAEKSIYINNQGFNQIELENNSRMILGYTGVEAFELKSEKNTVFSMKVLPGCALFNETFLEEGFKNDLLDGKIILETSEASDADKLIQIFKDKGIPYKEINQITGDYQNCENGLVTIYNNRASSSKSEYEVITRNFSYLTDIEY